MGLLALGTPLVWEDSKKYSEHVRTHGIAQFLNIWDKVKDRTGDTLLWGDEIEYMVVDFDDAEKNAKLSLKQTDILMRLQQVCSDLSDQDDSKSAVIPTFHPEYGRFMLESTPGAPFTGYVQDLTSVERDMRYRRKLIRSHLSPSQVPITIASFPRLGVSGVFTEPYRDPAKAEASQSLFLPDEITNPHVRFPTLTANIRRRRGSKVAINVPIFHDRNTPKPFVDNTIPWDRNVFPGDSEAKNGAALPDHIYMDAMGFGMGCCCLQITFQACNVTEARTVYDALVPISPIMLALTAAAPTYRGYLADVDCRWNIISASVDDRTEEERGLKPLKENRFQIPKSRYASVSAYIAEGHDTKYDDIPLPYDTKIFERLQNHGIDEALSKHISHLFIRDPLVVFSETIDQDDSISSDHFENIQSTNWQTLRFKPPPPNSKMGWRVEFRSMEVQVTDFENAAFSVFIVLLSRAILSFGLDFYMPLSKVDENMQRAQKRGAVTEQKFWFRKQPFPWGDSPPHPYSSPVGTPPTATTPLNGDEKTPAPSAPQSASVSRCPSPFSSDMSEAQDEIVEMTLSEIINGKGDEFPGLLGLVNVYLNSLDVEFAQKRKLKSYMDLIKRRADGSLITAATWIRNFIRSHPSYQFDSVISQEVNYDLIKTLDEIERGVHRADDFLPRNYVGSQEHK